MSAAEHAPAPVDHVRLAPADDSIRAALADALLAQDDNAAALTLQVENPSLALLVRRVALARGTERGALVKRAQDWLALEAARGDAIHHLKVLVLTELYHEAAITRRGLIMLR